MAVTAEIVLTESRSAVSTRPRRLHELDSLRGLAAVSVLFHHLFWLWKDEAFNNAETPSRKILQFFIQPISAGHEAVVLFFILSGFVLAIPAVEGRSQPYPVFMIRRVFRIYLPYLCALLLAVVGNWFFFGPVTKSIWFHQFWATPLQLSPVLHHAAFLGSYNTDRFDPPIWSLIHELRISIVFPALCWIALAIKPHRLFAILVPVSFACSWYVLRVGSLRSYLLSLHYVLFFVLGILLVDRAEWIRERFRWAPLYLKCLSVFLGLAFYLYAGKFVSQNRSLAHWQIYGQTLGDWFTAIGAAALIVISLNVQAFRNFLLRKPVHWLGEMSYSLYLTHFIVLLVLIHILYGRLNYALLLVLCMAASILFARLFFITVERPFMNLGRRFSKTFA